jgi:RluA family pseudouridine synthase
MKWVVPQTGKLVGFLQSVLDGEPSGKLVRRLLEANLCRVNGRIERFGSVDVERGDAVELSSAWKSILTPNLSRFETLLETDDFLIVDKPEGWVCNDESCKREFGVGKYLVHRLDKDTTGLLLIAKGSRARDELMELFLKRLVEKEYLALADGIPKRSDGTIENFLAKKKMIEGQTIWGSSGRGLEAVTRWNVEAVGKQASLIRCRPLTGRTHQIRVHLAEMGHPILIDRQYASQYRSKMHAKRPLLHATKIQFDFRGEKIEASSNLRADMREALQFEGIG